MPVGGMCVAKFVSRTQVYETLFLWDVLQVHIPCTKVVSLTFMRRRRCARYLASGRHLRDTTRLVCPNL